jgi:hypothetical protein
MLPIWGLSGWLEGAKTGRREGQDGAPRVGRPRQNNTSNAECACDENPILGPFRCSQVDRKSNLPASPQPMAPR